MTTTLCVTQYLNKVQHRALGTQKEDLCHQIAVQDCSGKTSEEVPLWVLKDE